MNCSCAREKGPARLRKSTSRNLASSAGQTSLLLQMSMASQASSVAGTAGAGNGVATGELLRLRWPPTLPLLPLLPLLLLLPQPSMPAEAKRGKGKSSTRSIPTARIPIPFTKSNNGCSNSLPPGDGGDTRLARIAASASATPAERCIFFWLLPKPRASTPVRGPRTTHARTKSRHGPPVSWSMDASARSSSGDQRSFSSSWP
mmetsp:Transcript_143827/g.358519  ORF Transcript_143827/g.358519 Transcript_143827/m.358519 type:complete len:203 (+) Transcript_143827:350-958(+)